MLQALFEQVLLKKLSNEQATESGLLLPEMKCNETIKCEVIGIGDKVEYVKIGDVVFCDKHIPFKMMYNGEEYLSIIWKEIKCKENM